MDGGHPGAETPASDAGTGAAPERGDGAPTEERTAPEVEGSRTHDPRTPAALVEMMSRDWEATSTFPDRPHPAAPRYAARRRALSALFPGVHLVVPTGVPKVRANDTEYRFRPGKIGRAHV